MSDPEYLAALVVLREAQLAQVCAELDAIECPNENCNYSFSRLSAVSGDIRNWWAERKRQDDKALRHKLQLRKKILGEMAEAGIEGYKKLLPKERIALGVQHWNPNLIAGGSDEGQ